MPKPLAPVARCMETYHRLFRERFGFAPRISGGKDGAHFKELIQLWGEPEVLRLLEHFFVTRDPRVLRSDYSVGAFYVLAQRLRIASGDGADGRLLDNREALRRAMAPQQPAITQEED